MTSSRWHPKRYEGKENMRKTKTTRDRKSIEQQNTRDESPGALYCCRQIHISPQLRNIFRYKETRKMTTWQDHEQAERKATKWRRFSCFFYRCLLTPSICVASAEVRYVCVVCEKRGLLPEMTSSRGVYIIGKEIAPLPFWEHLGAIAIF